MNISTPDLADYLARHPTFAELDRQTQQQLSLSLKWSPMLAGTQIIKEGEAGQQLYILHTGQLTVSREGHLLSTIKPGAILGEISLLGEQKNSATVTAIRDSLLLTADHQAIQSLMENSPTLVRLLAKLAINRLYHQQPNHPNEMEAQSISSLLPLYELSSSLAPSIIEPFFERNQEAITLLTREKLCSAIDFSGDQPPTSDQLQNLIFCLNQFEQPGKRLWLSCDQLDDWWNDFCLRQSDQLCLVAHKGDGSEIKPWEQPLQQGRYSRLKDNRTLLLINDPSIPSRNQFDWLVPRQLAEATEISVNDEGTNNALYQLFIKEAVDSFQLRDLALFDDLNAEQLATVETFLEPRFIQAGSYLYHQGEQTDALHIIESGRFSIIRDEQIVAQLTQGELVGEVALIAGTPRAASVRAERDSLVLQLSKEHFSQLINQTPKIYHQLAKVMAQRLAGNRVDLERDNPLTIALLPLSEQPEYLTQFHQLVSQLQQALDHYEGCGLIDAQVVDQTLGEGIAHLESQHPSAVLLAKWIQQQEQQQHYLLLIGDPSDNNWTKRCIRHADRVVLVDSHLNPFEPSHSEEQLKTLLEKVEPAAELVIIQPPQATEGEQTAERLKQRRINRHHHVRAGSQPDTERLARMLTDRACTIVLTGASTRAISHVGVLRALVEQGVSIDCVAGVSSGAAVAGLFCLGLDIETIFQKTVENTQNIIPRLSRFTFPYASLLSGFDAATCAHQLYGDKKLEDQFISCTMIAADIRDGEVVELSHGPIWQAARASTSLPVVWPPVTINDRVMVDGALLNNVPIHLFKQVSRLGLIMISDPNPSFTPFEGLTQYGEGLSGWRALWDKWFSREPKYYPSLLEIIGHAMCMESYRQQAEVDGLSEDKRLLFFSAGIASSGHFSVSDKEMMRQIEGASYENAIRVLNEQGSQSDALTPALTHQHKVI